MNKSIALAFAVGFASTAILATASMSEARPWGINARQNRQQNRIYNGTANGSLTRREARNLERQQMNLASREARMRASGNGLNQHERYKLEKQEDRLSRNIYNQKHDGQNR